MKTFEDLTTQELADLSDEQILRYQRMLAALDGIPLPGPEPVPFAEQKPSHDIVVYNVAGLSFLSRERAEEVQRFLMERQQWLVKTTYNWQHCGHAHLVESFEDDLAVSETTAYSAERYRELQHLIDNHSARKKAADAERLEWQKRKNAFDKPAEFVLNQVYAAKALIREQQINQQRFDEYLELAGGDAYLAWTFFTRAKLELRGFAPVGSPVTVGGGGEFIYPAAEAAQA